MLTVITIVSLLLSFVIFMVNRFHIVSTVDFEQVNAGCVFIPSQKINAFIIYLHYFISLFFRLSWRGTKNSQISDAQHMLLVLTGSEFSDKISLGQLIDHFTKIIFYTNFCQFHHKYKNISLKFYPNC